MAHKAEEAKKNRIKAGQRCSENLIRLKRFFFRDNKILWSPNAAASTVLECIMSFLVLARNFLFHKTNFFLLHFLHLQRAKTNGIFFLLCASLFTIEKPIFISLSKQIKLRNLRESLIRPHWNYNGRVQFLGINRGQFY